MNKKYKRDPKSLALLLSICLAILLIAIAVIIRFYSIRVLLTALVCAIIPFAFITIYKWAREIILKSTTIFSFSNMDAILPEKFIGKRFPVSLFRETNTSCHSA